MLSVRGARRVFPGGTVALDGADLTVPAGTVMSVLGPSGCGKTTLLRIIAGLDMPDAGTVAWDGTDLAGVPAHRRGFGMVFQDYALFPHRDVAANVAFGLRMQHLDRAEIRNRVTGCLSLVGLAGYERRHITQLSGGEQQRVALARALAPRPRLLLLDEPLGSLDRGLRERLAVDLRRICTEVGVTAVHVTHDQEEGFAIGDRVAIMAAGRVLQTGTPEAVWAAPASETVARFLGFANILDGPDGRVLIRPDAFTPDPNGCVSGTVTRRTFRGDHVLLDVACPSGATLEVAARWTPLPDVGARVRLSVDPSGVIPLP
jgi:thiamine transport system ATP-binding protein